MQQSTCSVPECTRPYRCKGFCKLHYDRWRASGRLDLPSREERFWSKVRRSSGCWTWTAAVGRHGYGMFGVENHRMETAPRFSWQLHFGPVPQGTEVCHRCDNRLCVRPDHLFVGTRMDNVRDMLAKGRGKTKGRWSIHSDACRGCGTVEREHEGRGLCGRCFSHRRKWLADTEVSATHDREMCAICRAEAV